MMSGTIRTGLLALLLFAGAALGAEPAETQQVQPTPAETSANSAEQERAANPSAAPRAQSQSPQVTPSEAAGAQPQSTRAAPGRRAANDRLDLDTTIVTGNRELPKVLYIVPWKKADLGDLPAQPFNTLLDEVLTPVDRDVFRREVTYYEVVSSSHGEPGGAPARGDEK